MLFGPGNYFRLIAVPLCMALILSSCGTVSRVRSAVKPKPAPAPAPGFVSADMDRVLVSIDRQLQTLLIVERGGESPRTPMAIGDTVAGADRYGTPDARGPIRAPLPPPKPADPLSSLVNIDWSGPAPGLLREVATGIGYSYREQGCLRCGSLSVRIKRSGYSMTVLDLLNEVARQIDARADIRVNHQDRTVTLIHR